MLGIAAICLQMLGTLWLLVVVYFSSRLAEFIPSTRSLESTEVHGDAIIDSVRSQFRQQWPGFALLLVGILFDMVDRALSGR